MKKISVVLPIYNEEGNLSELYIRLVKVLKEIGLDYELIFVNDCSKDNSLNLLFNLAKKDPQVKLLNFSRNFGHQLAITAGIDHASGDAVIPMDADLQDTPETLKDLVAKWQEGFEVVYAQRRTRKDSIPKKIAAFTFYRTLKKVANINIPEDTGDFRLMDRKVVDQMKKMKEKARFLRGMTSWVGFKQTAVLFDRDERRYGVSNYPFLKLLKLALDGVTSFSFLPLRLTYYVGTLALLLGLGGIIMGLVQKLAWQQSPSDLSLILSVIFFLAGLQFFVMGILGDYLGRVYAEAQNRPLYVLRDKVNFDHEE